MIYQITVTYTLNYVQILITADIFKRVNIKNQWVIWPLLISAKFSAYFASFCLSRIYFFLVLGYVSILIKKEETVYYVAYSNVNLYSSTHLSI